MAKLITARIINSGANPGDFIKIGQRFMHTVYEIKAGKEVILIYIPIGAQATDGAELATYLLQNSGLVEMNISTSITYL